MNNSLTQKQKDNALNILYTHATNNNKNTISTPEQNQEPKIISEIGLIYRNSWDTLGVKVFYQKKPDDTSKGNTKAYLFTINEAHIDLWFSLIKSIMGDKRDESINPFDIGPNQVKPDRIIEHRVIEDKGDF